ncbi:MAG: hypothetical protein QOH55_2367 [Microbacteriaceae bacterium]|jgi:uncharacterized repeat protein (TIGR04042 family)|nr:hypothetical protein [Microbacteriaceae bacterium]
MPEMTFTVRWPDGTVADLYSPSLVMHDFLSAGSEYPLQDFVTKSAEALDVASARVKAKFGFECTSAMQQKAEILATAKNFNPSAAVRVLSMLPPLEA